MHRARLWTYDLPDFGWTPIILTTHPKHYECRIDEDLLSLLPDGLEVIRTEAFPTRPIRFVGDIGIRSLPWYYRAMRDLAARRKIDFLHITVPAFPAALLGPRVTRNLGIPFGIDYIDPWVPETPRDDPFLSKSWLAHIMNRVLEPIAVRGVRLITGINEAYFHSVFIRNPQLNGRVVTAGMPYGGSERDLEALQRKPRKPFLFPTDDGKLHVIYAGALLPKALEVLDRLMAALVIIRDRNAKLADLLRVHFVGTGLYESDPTRGHIVEQYIERHGLGGMVDEHPGRISYLDVLNHLQLSAAILVLGSTEVHYSPSKIYQSVMAKRPVFALLHRDSTAVPTLMASRAGEVFTFTAEELPVPRDLADALERFLFAVPNWGGEVNWSAFSKVTARESSRVLAEALDRAAASADEMP